MRYSKRDDRSCCSDDSGSDVFRNVPKNTSTFCVWKIESLRAIPVPRNKVFNLLSDSAYIFYTVSSKDSAHPYPGMPIKEVKESMAIRAVHFWIGSDCDTTVSGAAALRAAELDSQVSATVLMREAQGRESPRFLSYFRQELIVSNSNSESLECRLHRVTGVVNPILTELDGVRWDNFTSQDVILLDWTAKGIIFLWLGYMAEPLHKRHASRILEMKKENNNVRVIIVEDGYEQTLRDEDRRVLDEILDPVNRSVAPERNSANYAPSPIKLYKCTEQSNKYKVAEIKSGPIFRPDLASDSVFLLDRGEAGVWAWVGKSVDIKEKLEAVRNARGFIKKKGYSTNVPVARAIEGQEPPEIKCLLRGWETTKPRPLTLPSSFEPDYMNERPKISAECQLVDDGRGDRITWRVNHSGELLEIEDNGVYYAESCYILQYRYGSGRRCKTIIYCWSGVHSSSGNREVALEASCQLAEDTSSQLVKASQGREPPHLLQIYGGKLIILAGPHQNMPPLKYLVRVFGSTPYTSKAVERPLRASSLDSMGVFILFSNSPVVWCGSKSTGDAREASRRLAPGNAPLISEGREDNEFWEQLGGRGTFGTESTESEEQLGIRFYRCRAENGIFYGEEVLGFTQNTLIPESEWLIDAGNVIWVWVGQLSTIKTLKKSVEAATTFLYTHPAGRDRNTPISIIRQGYEPSTFIGLFENWNHNLLRDYRSFDVSRMFLQDREYDPVNVRKVEISEFDDYVKYPLKVLKSDAENLPSGVNVSRKEMHLTFDDFTSLFKMCPLEFEKLPIWKRQRLKQSAGLF